MPTISIFPLHLQRMGELSLGILSARPSLADYAILYYIEPVSQLPLSASACHKIGATMLICNLGTQSQEASDDHDTE